MARVLLLWPWPHIGQLNLRYMQTFDTTHMRYMCVCMADKFGNVWRGFSFNESDDDDDEDENNRPNNKSLHNLTADQQQLKQVNFVRNARLF